MGTATKGKAGGAGKSTAGEIARDEAADLRHQAALQATLRRMLATHERRFGKLELEPGAYNVQAELTVTGDVTKGKPTGGGGVAADVTTKDVALALLSAPIIPDLSPLARLSVALDYQRDARKGQATKTGKLAEADRAWKELTHLCETRKLTKETPARTGSTGGTLAITGSFEVDANEVTVQVGGA